MANPIHLKLEDDGGNEIKGSSTVQGREGTVEVLSFHHEVKSPTDDSTGAITGTRVHSAVRLTKSRDASSVYLQKAVTTGQTLKGASFGFYRINDAGKEACYYEIVLENVKVTRVASRTDNVKDPAFAKQPDLEDVEFRYEKILWVHTDGNLSHVDEWDLRPEA